MRFLAAALLAIALAGPLSACSGEASGAPAYASAKLLTEDGTAVSLSDWRGKVGVVNFWATWCGPCRLEIPHFNATYRKYRERGVEFVGVATDRDGWPAINAFREEVPIEYPVVLDPGKAFARSFDDIDQLPTTVVIGRDGTVVYERPGFIDAETLERIVEAAL